MRRTGMAKHTDTVTATLTPATAKTIREQAKREDRTVSQVVRRALVAAFGEGEK